MLIYIKELRNVDTRVYSTGEFTGLKLVIFDHFCHVLVTYKSISHYINGLFSLQIWHDLRGSKICGKIGGKKYTLDTHNLTVSYCKYWNLLHLQILYVTVFRLTNLHLGKKPNTTEERELNVIGYLVWSKGTVINIRINDISKIVNFLMFNMVNTFPWIYCITLKTCLFLKH